MFFVNLMRLILDNCIVKQMAAVDNMAIFQESLATATKAIDADAIKDLPLDPAQAERVHNYAQLGLFQVCFICYRSGE